MNQPGKRVLFPCDRKTVQTLIRKAHCFTADWQQNPFKIQRLELKLEA
jgi:hypothetical protein